MRWPNQWRDLVFLSEAGTPLEPVNLGRKTRRIAKAAGIGHVRPDDLPESFGCKPFLTRAVGQRIVAKAQTTDP